MKELQIVNQEITNGEIPVAESTTSHRLILESEVYLNCQLETFEIPINTQYLSTRYLTVEELDQAEVQMQFNPDYSRICFNCRVEANYRDDDGNIQVLSGECINKLINEHF